MVRLGRAFPIRPHVIPSTLRTVGVLPLHYYSTTFALTEDPMAEGGIWVQGTTDGLDWQNVKTSGGNAFGKQSGSSGVVYDDSIAVLRGTFGADQRGQATVFRTNGGGNWHAEVEILLRFTITANRLTGYEINFNTSGTDNYCTIVRFDSSAGIGANFTTLNTTFPGQTNPGDVVSATMIGSTITAYVNGTSVNTATDATYTSGNPGIGFFLKNLGSSGDSTTFGFSDYTAQTLDIRRWRQVVVLQAGTRAAVY